MALPATSRSRYSTLTGGWSRSPCPEFTPEEYSPSNGEDQIPPEISQKLKFVLSSRKHPLQCLNADDRSAMINPQPYKPSSINERPLLQPRRRTSHISRQPLACVVGRSTWWSLGRVGLSQQCSAIARDRKRLHVEHFVDEGLDREPKTYDR